jgi:prepilin-type N-terminal cleavage/methylation domain-containing protein/prepilin-type processing-associated H-X9-DG protein
MPRMRRGFSLLELIVVMAILAVAVGVLLPAVHRARSRSAEVFCQSNLRTLSIAVRQYTIEYNDRYPFGFTFNRMLPNNGRPSDAGASGVIAWYSSIDKYLTNGTTEAYLLDFNTGFFDGATTRNFHPAFKCPTVPSSFQQQVHYYNHPVVMPHMPLELHPEYRPFNGLITKPAKVNQLYPNTALIWDTPLFSQAAPQTPSMFWFGSPDTVSGLTLPMSKIDNARLRYPNLPHLRYRGLGGDRYASSSNQLENPAGPIWWPSDQFMQSNPISPTWNTDFGSIVFTNAVGGPRFRHTGKGCNVLFADGSVRTLYLHPSRKVADGPVGTGSADFIDSDFRRYMLMIKWPAGTSDLGGPF